MKAEALREEAREDNTLKLLVAEKVISKENRDKIKEARDARKGKSKTQNKQGITIFRKFEKEANRIDFTNDLNNQQSIDTCNAGLNMNGNESTTSTNIDEAMNANPLKSFSNKLRLIFEEKNDSLDQHKP